jgi:N utilization substance protein A
MRTRSKMFIDALDVDDVIAHLLVTEGFTNIEEVAFVPVEELASIEGFDEDVARELRERARVFLQEQNEKLSARRRELGVDDTLATIEGLTPAMLVTLGENGVKTLDDLADLSSDELIDPQDGILRGTNLSSADANSIIMAARAHWFADQGEVPADQKAGE